jgi:hypothetical protein
MAMIFVDGFGHYVDGNLASKWDVVADDLNCIAQSPTSGRFGLGGIVYTFGTNSFSKAQYIQRNFTGASTVICGFAFQQSGTQTTQGGRLITLLDGATRQVCIDVLPSGQLRAVRSTTVGSGVFDNGQSTVLGTSTSAIASSSFDYLEFKIVHHPSNGSITVKRNGSETFWTATGLNTAVSGNSSSSSLLLGGVCTFGGATEDHFLKGTVSDFYLLDTTGAGPDNDFLGDIQVEPLRPTADGNYTEWTPNTGTDHFALVDDASNSIDGDATYNSSSTIGNRDTFIFENSAGPVGAAVKVVCYTMYCEKTTGGSNAVKGLARLAATDALGTETQIPSPYGFRQSFATVKPGGGSWTVQDVNDAEFGYQKTV